jgi:hypothetical protein
MAGEVLLLRPSRLGGTSGHESALDDPRVTALSCVMLLQSRDFAYFYYYGRFTTGRGWKGMRD